MAYVRNLHEIKEVKETTDMSEVNRLIEDGWMLLRIITPNHDMPTGLRFSLGRVDS